MSLTIQDESIMQKATVIGHVTKMSVVLALVIQKGNKRETNFSFKNEQSSVYCFSLKHHLFLPVSS